MTNGDGIFRVSDLNASDYQLDLRREGFEDFNRQSIRLGSSEVLSVEVKMRAKENAVARGPLDRPLAGALPPTAGQTEAEAQEPYRELRRRPTETAPDQSVAPETPPTENENFTEKIYRWDITNNDPKDPLNAYRRYAAHGEYEYTSGHWW